MIRVELPWLFFFYLLVFLAVIFTVWIFCEMAKRFRETRALRDRVQCRICGMIYRVEDERAPTGCPRCKALNEHSKINIY